jgi:iron complex outermembrane receptor protein
MKRAIFAPSRAVALLSFSFVWFVVIFTSNLYAQEAEEIQGSDEGIITLPEAAITEKKDTTEYITQETLEREDSWDLWEALRNVPGVMRDGGGGKRNESNFSIRGMDEKLLPVFIDGIPVSAPYRGEADTARFLAADLEDIEIQKGYSSMLLGPNTFGGAIVMRTAKPKKTFETSFKTGLDFDSVFKYAGITNAYSIGTKQSTFYAKGVFQTRAIDHYRLSDKFTPSPYNLQQKGERLFSDTKDIKLTLLVGWTLNEFLSINANYILQDSDKGVSPEETAGTQSAYSIWTLWRRQNVSLDCIYKGENFDVKALFFFDKFDNELETADSLAQVELKQYRDPSIYDDYGTGFRLEGEYTINTHNSARAAFNFKQDSHKENKNGADTKDIKENTVSFGAEYETTPITPLTCIAGFGIDYFAPYSFWSINYTSESPAAFMWSAQAGVFYDITTNHTIHFTFARKNHVPTMRMRYADSFGESGEYFYVLPNPDLKPENVLHYELGYKGTFFYKDAPLITLTAAAYYSSLTNMLAEKTIPGGIQRVNADKTDYYGIEGGVKLFTTQYLTTGAAISINKYTIVYNEAGLNAAGNYPTTTFNAYMVINPLAASGKTYFNTLSIIPSVEYEGRRYGSTRLININSSEILEAWILVNLKISADLDDNFSLSASVQNLFDENYYLQSNALPLAGRSFTFSFTGKY